MSRTPTTQTNSNSAYFWSKIQKLAVLASKIYFPTIRRVSQAFSVCEQCGRSEDRHKSIECASVCSASTVTAWVWYLSCMCDAEWRQPHERNSTWTISDQCDCVYAIPIAHNNFITSNTVEEKSRLIRRWHSGQCSNLTTHTPITIAGTGILYESVFEPMINVQLYANIHTCAHTHTNIEIDKCEPTSVVARW